MSAPTLYQWRRRGLDVGAKPYDPAAVRAWRDANLRPKVDALPTGADAAALLDAEPDPANGVDPQSATLDGSLESMSVGELRRQLLVAQIRQTDAAAELKGIKIAIERGELLALDRVKERDMARIAAVRGALLSIPRRLAQELEGLDAAGREHRIREAVETVLTRFSEM